MTLDAIIHITAALVVIAGPLVVLALAADRFGTDSRPVIEDRDQRPWLSPMARG